jgi:signal transduction histidine kinase
MQYTFRMFRKYIDIAPDSLTPIPPRQFAWYVNFWHIVYLAILALMLGLAWWEGRASFGWREIALAGLVLGQLVLYFRFLVFNRRWPIPGRNYVVYFAGSIAIWFLEWQLSPTFFWLIMSYLGQMYGLLPPIYAVPATSLIYVFVFGNAIGWDSSKLDFGDWLGILMSYTASNVVFIFIYYISRTSSERAQLIVDLKKAQAELEAARQRETELAVFRERERLARDLHDSLGHALVSISVQLEAIQRLYKVDAESASQQIDELKTLTRHSIDDLRRSLDGLRAPGLGERSLPDALQTLCVETSQRLNLPINCHLDEGARDLTPAVAESIWRVTQEALTNIGRHSHAGKADVSLLIQGGTVTLRITDDGVGLPPDSESRPGHYGLRGIRERVEGLGGNLKFLNGNGTTIEATIPIVASP